MKLNVRFIETNTPFLVTFDETFHHFGAILEEVQKVTEYVGGEVYKGDYEITPKVLEQRAYTAGKVMLEDITIHSIPYFDVSNLSGGSTVYIGGDI